MLRPHLGLPRDEQESQPSNNWPIARWDLLSFLWFTLDVTKRVAALGWSVNWAAGIEQTDKRRRADGRLQTHTATSEWAGWIGYWLVFGWLVGTATKETKTLSQRVSPHGVVLFSASLEQGTRTSERLTLPVHDGTARGVDL